MKSLSVKLLQLLSAIICSSCISPNADRANYSAMGDFGLTIVNSSGYILKVNSAKYAVMHAGPVSHEISTGDTMENHVEHSSLTPGDTVYIARMSNNGWSMVVTIFAYDVEGRLVGRGQKLFERPINVKLRPIWAVVNDDLHH